MARKYKRLRYDDRQTIEKMLKAGDSIAEIAVALGVHRDTIYKELNRSGTDQHTYTAAYMERRREWRQRERYKRQRRLYFLMAWTNEADGGYNLFIGAEGGVAANENSDHLFCMYVNLKKINFNNNLHTENAVSMSGMFSGCGNLTELNLKAFDTSDVTRMAAMFYGCANINVLDVSNFDTSNVMYMDFMFYGCESLTELDVNGFDTSSLTDASYMFYGCTSLPAPNVSNLD